MKTFVHGIVMIAVGIFVILAVYTVMISMNMKKQLYNAMSTAVDAAVEQAMDGCGYSLSDVEEFKYEFLQDLCLQSDKDGELKVDFNHVDYDEGLMAVTVTKEFKYPIRTKGHVKISKIVIFEEEMKDDELYTVSFVDADDKTIKAYKGYKGSALKVPMGEYIDAEGREVGAEIIVTKDEKYIKVGD